MSQPKHTQTFRHSLVAMAIASVVAMPAVAQEANADNAQANDDYKGLERIEVTARRRTESIQEVPVSVSSFSAGDLAEIGAEDITELQQRIPNTTLQVSRGTNSTLTAYIRGVGQQDPLWGFEPGVGIYIDDVYIARPQGAVLEVLDLERIEVLRGPQGTLYGKNTIGGALKYVTKELTGYDEFSVQGTVGTYGQKDLKISGQTALSDTFFVGGALATLNRDGFGEFVNTGDENYNKELMTGRVSAKWLVSDDVSAKFMYDKTKDDSNSKGGYRLTSSQLTGQDPYQSVYDSNTAMPVENLVETEGYSLTIDWDINENWAFKSVTAAREGYTMTNIDFDSTGAGALLVPADYEDEQTTQEFQLSYAKDRTTFVGGVYYYDGEACGIFGTVLPQLLGVGLTIDNGGCVDTKSTALYGQINYDMTDNFSFTVGGRYTEDEKSANVLRQTFLGVKFLDRSGSATLLSTNSDFSAEEKWTHFSPHASMRYRITDDTMVYGSYSNGFKSGGVDMRADATLNPDAVNPYDPEIVDTYEAGIKTEFWDDRIRLNAAWFLSNYSDMQVTVQRAVPAGVASQVLNAAEATVYGFEIEAVAAVTDSLNVTAMMGNVNAAFDSVRFFDPVAQETTDVSDLWSFANTPELVANLGFNQSLENEYGQWVWSGNMAYRSETQIFEVPSMLDMGGYSLFNTSLMWYSNDGNWSAGLHVKNIGNKVYRLAGYNFAAPRDANGNRTGPGLGGEDTIVGYYGDPRTVSLTVGYRF